ncbi:MAG: UvrD-helicase domain-containing protein, partial [Clostridia bacterium]|nr:UvrD-helicase domain-containing protein [Clostridia bacterium]
MPNWTEAQRQAIDARNSETLVSAAAGSGKTAVLVEHVLQMLRDGGNISRLLIITFTRAAAAELRERLMNAISNETAENKHMRTQLRAARHAQISTLHVFCHHIIREYFQSADVDPMAKIADETTLNPLLARAVDDAMEALCASEDEDAKSLVSQYGDDQIVDMAKQLYYFLQAQADPQGFLDRTMEDPLGDGLKPFLLLLKKEALMRIEGALQLNDQCKALLERPNAPKYLQSTVENDRIVLEGLQQEMRSREPDRGELHFATKSRAPKNAEFDASLAERFSKLRERMKELAGEAAVMVPRDLEEARSEIAYTLPALRALIALTKDIEKRYAGLKEARDLLDYNDLEHKALLALSDERVRTQVSAAYDAIFVDEYQDVSAIQEAIVRCIHNDNNRLFMVGDVKQSIYRFRLADPSLFLAKYNEFEEKSDAPARKILLSSNFRSRGNVLAAVNCVFARAMRRGATEIDYDEAAQLRAGIPTEGDPPVELHLISESADEEDEKNEEDTRKGWMYEAQLAAQRILALIGTPIRCKEGVRPLHYRDCVILLRNASGRAGQIAKILANEGVPAYSDADAQFFELPEVRDM